MSRKPPKSGKPFQKIVERGCGIHFDEWNGDYDCSHGYTWPCEKCPCTIYAEKLKREAHNERA